MGFLIFCLVVGFVIYSIKKDDTGQTNSYTVDVYPKEKAVSTPHIKKSSDEFLDTSIPPVKTKYQNCIKFASNKLKLKYLVCGDFYFFQNSEVVIKEPNVFNYWLYASIDKKGFREIAKFKNKPEKASHRPSRSKER